jgi:hypothetical protein
MGKLFLVQLVYCECRRTGNLIVDLIADRWQPPIIPIALTVAMLTKTAQKWVGKIAQWTLIYSTTFQNGEAISGAACLLRMLPNWRSDRRFDC